MPKQTKMDDIKPLADAIAVHRNEYDSGGADYSVTTLLDPPRVVMLNKRHMPKVDLYVSDLFHSYNGTGSHSYMEYCLNKMPGNLWECETRLTTTIDDRIISGAFDFLYKGKILYDLKTTSVWKVRFGSKEDWTAQQNIYRWLYWKLKGKVIEELNIVGLFRDWSLPNLQRAGRPQPGENEYPRFPGVQITLDIWEFDYTKNFIKERLALMIANEDVADDDLPPCSYKEMWSDPDSVAVMSTRLKSRALRVLSSQAAAEKFVEKHLQNPNCKDSVQKLSYQVRPAVRKRCEDWCPVNKYCNQWAKHCADNCLTIKGKKKP